MNTTETTQEMCYNCGEFIYEDKHNCSLEETQPSTATYKDENCDGWANYTFKPSENTPQAKAEAISQTMKVANLHAIAN